MQEMGRGVTSIAGTGMFTGKTHSLLLCALTITEIPHIKVLVAEADPKAFVVVIPAQEVLGMGFMPLKENGIMSCPPPFKERLEVNHVTINKIRHAHYRLRDLPG